MNQKTAAIILAAGRGSRLNSVTQNKVTLPFRGKPIIQYAVDVMDPVARPIVVVVGAFADSVRDTLKDRPNVLYAHQSEQLGTGHAAQIGFEALPPDVENIYIGYGDHMMFYKPETVKALHDTHVNSGADISFLTTVANDPESLAWGHIVRDSSGNVTGIVEHKDANEDEKHIKEVNPGFYLCTATFLREAFPLLHLSDVTGEYYLTELIHIAVERGNRVNGMIVPFDEVGIGVNRREELEESQKLHQSVRAAEGAV